MSNIHYEKTARSVKTYLTCSSIFNKMLIFTLREKCIWNKAKLN